MWCAVHRSWMTEFSVALHNYSGTLIIYCNSIAMHPCLNLKCPGDIISTQVIEYRCMSRAIVDCTDSETILRIMYDMDYIIAPFALH